MSLWMITVSQITLQSTFGVVISGLIWEQSGCSQQLICKGRGLCLCQHWTIDWTCLCYIATTKKKSEDLNCRAYHRGQLTRLYQHDTTVTQHAHTQSSPDAAEAAWGQEEEHDGYSWALRKEVGRGRGQGSFLRTLKTLIVHLSLTHSRWLCDSEEGKALFLRSELRTLCSIVQSFGLFDGIWWESTIHLVTRPITLSTDIISCFMLCSCHVKNIVTILIFTSELLIAFMYC